MSNNNANVVIEDVKGDHSQPSTILSTAPKKLSPEMIDVVTKARAMALTTQSTFLTLSKRLKELEDSQDFSSVEIFPYPSYSKMPQLVKDHFFEIRKKKALNNHYSSFRSASNGGSNPPPTSQLYHNLNILSRLYVGSIHFELSDADLKAAFSIFGPVKNISMTIDPETLSHKGFCFVEFETPDGAALALDTMNGGDLGGRSLKVGRPMNFPPDLPPGVPRPLPNRLYIASVRDCVSEADLREVFSAFGTVSSLSLIPDAQNKRRHRGYGYVEYSDSASAKMAMTALKGFQLGGLELRVGRTTVGGPMPGGMSSVTIEELSSSSQQKGSSYSNATSAKKEKPLPPAVRNALKGIEAALGRK